MPELLKDLLGVQEYVIALNEIDFAIHINILSPQCYFVPLMYIIYTIKNTE